MSKHMIRPEDVEVLKQNPYVAGVNQRVIHFTIEFKQRFYEEYQMGKSPEAILRELGIDPAMLGPQRASGIRTHVLEQAKRACGFTDRGKNKYQYLTDTRARNTDERLARLEHSLMYTQQELAYIKKLILADREAQREWALKHRLTSNLKSSET